MSQKEATSKNKKADFPTSNSYMKYETDQMWRGGNKNGLPSVA